MSYFSEVVLPSAKMSRKVSYTIPETVKILDCHMATFYRRVGRGEITVTKDKRIYYIELEKYFEDCETKDCKKRLKNCLPNSNP